MTEQMRLDMTVLRGMAMMNVAGMDFETFRKRNAEYHDFKERCVRLYGREATIHYEYYGVPSTGGSNG